MPKRLEGLDLPAWHPFAGRLAMQCEVCHGIYYPASAEAPCPYCHEEDPPDAA